MILTIKPYLITLYVCLLNYWLLVVNVNLLVFFWIIRHDIDDMVYYIYSVSLYFIVLALNNPNYYNLLSYNNPLTMLEINVLISVLLIFFFITIKLVMLFDDIVCWFFSQNLFFFYVYITYNDIWYYFFCFIWFIFLLY